MTPYLYPGLKTCNPDVLIRHFCETFKIEKNSLLSKSRKGSIPIVRQTLMHLIHKCLFKTQVEVGLIFDRDHSTVSCSKKNVENLWITNKNYRKTVIELCKASKIDLGLTNLKQ